MEQHSKVQSKSNYRFKKLQQINTDVNWVKLAALIKPHLIAGNTNITNGNICHFDSIETMFRIYFLQLRYSMTAASIEEHLFKVEALRTFANIEINDIPHESYIKAFETIIKTNNLVEKIEDIFN